MPYVLKRGTIYGQPYKCGDFVPGEKGSMADMEAAGAVEWVDAPVREPAKKAEPEKKLDAKPKAAPAKPSEPPNPLLKGGQHPSKRKAVKP